LLNDRPSPRGEGFFMHRIKLRWCCSIQTANKAKMKNLFFKTVLVAIVTVLSFTSQAQFVIRVRPVAPLVRVRPIAPSPVHIWVSGDWVWRGGRYVWADGYWAAPRRGNYWREGHWKNARRGWVWVPGRWRR
jgi:hypothetical protein